MSNSFSYSDSGYSMDNSQPWGQSTETVSGSASTTIIMPDWPIECKTGPVMPPEIGEWEVKGGKIYLYFRCLPVVRIIRVTKGVLAAPNPMFVVAVKEYIVDEKESAVVISGTFSDNEKYQLFYEIEGGRTAMEEYHNKLGSS